MSTFPSAVVPASPTFVTKPSLPPLRDFIPLLEQIWSSGILTNAGPFHAAFERELAKYLGVEHVSLVNNGTVALIIALQFLPRRGEVITTPYTFVATANALLWTGHTPVFVDIDPLTCNLNPAKVEQAVNENTVAILPVHCYGTPCDLDAIDAVAKGHGLTVIYDAAHAFDVRRNGRSILEAGDLSTLSFHATKVFNTFEGGAIISRTAEAKQRVAELRNFGFLDEVTVVAAGMNGKMAEINAAFGLLQLQHIQNEIGMRSHIDLIYRRILGGVRGVRLLDTIPDIRPNYGYFPIFIEPDYRLSRDDLYNQLKERGYHCRRYFYPLVTTFPMYSHLPSAARARLPNAHSLADQVMCLPIYSSLDPEEAEKIARLIAGWA